MPKSSIFDGKSPFSTTDFFCVLASSMPLCPFFLLFQRSLKTEDFKM